MGGAEKNFLLSKRKASTGEQAGLVVGQTQGAQNRIPALGAYSKPLRLDTQATCFNDRHVREEDAEAAALLRLLKGLAASFAVELGLWGKFL